MTTLIFKKWHAKLAGTNVGGWKQETIIDPLAEACEKLSSGISWKTVINSFWSLRKMAMTTIMIVSSMGVSYWMGHSSNADKLMHMEAELAHSMGLLNDEKMDKISAELKLKSFMSSRSYKEFLIFKDAQVAVPESLPTEDIETMLSIANEYDIPNYIYFRVIQTESHFKWSKNGKVLTSSAGAQGYMQVIPSTFSAYCKRLNIKNEMNVENNLRVGAKLLSDLYEMYNPKGDRNDMSTWKKPLMAYNAGCGNVNSGRAYQFKETKNYIKKILQK